MKTSKSQLAWPNIIWQPLLALVFVAVVLYLFSFAQHVGFTWAVGAGAIASSSYLVFGTPSSRAARVRNIIGGYLIAIVCSMIVQYLVRSLDLWCVDILHCGTFTMSLFVSALVVGLALVIMAVLRCQHPPAAGLALTLVIDARHFDILFLVMLAAILLSLIATVLKNHLKDLVE